MSRIRRVEIENFRSIQSFDWRPSAGINCLIGPGDSGKSSVLDAIDYCLGARRMIQFSDADFHDLDVSKPIKITLTIGNLPDDLRRMDSYGMYVRGLDTATGEIHDEPGAGLETGLTLRLTVASDLEPSWSLISERAAAQGQERNLSWADRVRLAPNRIGATAAYHLGWRRGSVLNRISPEPIDASAALAAAAREARANFGEQAKAQLEEALAAVLHTAQELGIPVGEQVQALLDAHSISFSAGTISLHDDHGVPLASLGVGSTRLLIAGLQRKAKDGSAIVLVDEVEYGLEPHRIVRFLGSLGSKKSPPPLQVFMTTHAPVVLRELSGDQLWILRADDTSHTVRQVGLDDGAQGTIRSFPEAFLAPQVMVGEGASEVGLVRGLDQYRVSQGSTSIAAHGTALIDCGGGPPDRPFERGTILCGLGYEVAIIRDNDVNPTVGADVGFELDGGKVFQWRNGRALEDDLFMSLSDSGVSALLAYAVELHGRILIDEHIKSVSNGTSNLEAIEVESLVDGIGNDARATLGKAARTKATPWFKTVSHMERVAREIIGPDLANSDEEFRKLIEGLFAWAENG